MDAIDPQLEGSGSVREPVFELRVRVPAELVAALDALVDKRYVGGRSEAVRALLYAGLRAQQ
jgi:metal-responsive CopG/Arc/MetJ family transcriptional regulator